MKKFSKVCPACEILRSLREQEGGTSLVIQWLRLCIPSAGGLSSIPSQGTKPRMLQLNDPGTSKLEKKKKKGARRKPLTRIPRDFTGLTWPVKSHGIYYGCLRVSDIFVTVGTKRKVDVCFPLTGPKRDSYLEISIE